VTGKRPNNTFRRMLEGKITTDRYVAIVKRYVDGWMDRTKEAVKP
jgi:hypothetical protein